MVKSPANRPLPLLTTDEEEIRIVFDRLEFEAQTHDGWPDDGLRDHGEGPRVIGETKSAAAAEKR
jgi:hypothetical protein